MTHIKMYGVDVDIPLYGVGARQLRALVSGVVKTWSRKVWKDHEVLTVRALRGISLDFREGDRVALLGRNGAGKTTLLRVLAGIYHPTRGHIERVGKVQSVLDVTSGLEEEATGRENILIRARYMGVDGAKARAAIDDIVAFAELDEFIDLPIRTYSSGMRLRLAFAITTTFVHDIMIIDEILGVGDAAFQKKAADRMTSSIQNAGLVVLATHALTLSEQLANRAVLIEGGMVAADGSYAETVEAYQQMALTAPSE